MPDHRVFGIVDQRGNVAVVVPDVGSHAPVEVGGGVVLNFSMDEHQGAGLKDEGLRESGGIGANRPPPGSGPRARMRIRWQKDWHREDDGGSGRPWARECMWRRSGRGGPAATAGFRPCS